MLVVIMSERHTTILTQMLITGILKILAEVGEATRGQDMEEVAMATTTSTAVTQAVVGKLATMRVAQLTDQQDIRREPWEDIRMNLSL
jgi:hypothetical protein